MEENNLINNDNTYNTDMSTSQSTIGGNATTNNKFNKDDLQEVTGGGGGGGSLCGSGRDYYFSGACIGY